jgi:hypothetical protein
MLSYLCLNSLIILLFYCSLNTTMLDWGYVYIEEDQLLNTVGGFVVPRTIPNRALSLLKSLITSCKASP